MVYQPNLNTYDVRPPLKDRSEAMINKKWVTQQKKWRVFILI